MSIREVMAARVDRPNPAGRLLAAPAVVLLAGATNPAILWESSFTSPLLDAGCQIVTFRLGAPPDALLPYLMSV